MAGKAAGKLSTARSDLSELRKRLSAGMGPRHTAPFRRHFCRAAGSYRPVCWRRSCAAAGQGKHFPAERLRRAGRHDSAVLHLGTGANQTPPQPPERHADLPGTGVQRLDYPKKAGLGQARAHYAELPSGCKAYRKGGRRCTSLTPSSGCRTARSFV